MPDDTGFRYLPVEAADLRRELYVTSVGRQTYPKGARYPAPGHPADYAFDWRRGRTLGDFALVFVEHGGGVFEMEERRAMAWRAGDVLLLPPGVWHRYRPDPATGWTEAWCCLNGDLLHRFRAKGLFPSAPVLRPVSDSRAFLAAWRGVYALSGRNTLQLAARALAVLAAVLEADERRPDGVVFAKTADAAVDRALELIWYNCHRPLDVAGVARHAGVTRRTLERRFATLQLRSVASEIEWARLQRARQLLGETGMSIKEIGYTAGFGGPTRFIRAFRKRFGSTPGLVREQMATENAARTAPRK